MISFVPTSNRNRIGFILAMFVVSALGSACHSKKIDIVPEPTKDTFVVFDYSVQQLVTDNSYAIDHSKGGLLQSSTLTEASGLVVSRSNPDVLWIHNDSGSPNRLHATGSKGQDYGTFSITGAGSRDYEDIAIGVGPTDGLTYLYVADIGDNHARYNYVVVYRFPEPDIRGLTTPGWNTFPEATLDRLEFTYPDGPRDAETLLLDPWTKDLYIVSKRDYKSVLYRARFPQSTSSRTVLEKVAQLPFNWAVGGDISADGKKIVIKDRNRIYLWVRNEGETVVEAMKRQPVLLPYVLEPQGESFGWTPDGNGYYTVSERDGGPAPPIYYYSKK